MHLKLNLYFTKEVPAIISHNFLAPAQLGMTSCPLLYHKSYKLLNTRMYLSVTSLYPFLPIQTNEFPFNTNSLILNSYHGSGTVTGSHSTYFASRDPHVWDNIFQTAAATT